VRIAAQGAQAVRSQQGLSEAGADSRRGRIAFARNGQGRHESNGKPRTGCESASQCEFCYDSIRASPDGDPNLLSPENSSSGWHNSDWYQLGMDALLAAA
jgi:hypothetical protein